VRNERRARQIVHAGESDAFSRIDP